MWLLHVQISQNNKRQTRNRGLGVQATTARRKSERCYMLNLQVSLPLKTRHITAATTGMLGGRGVFALERQNSQGCIPPLSSLAASYHKSFMLRRGNEQHRRLYNYHLHHLGSHREEQQQQSQDDIQSLLRPYFSPVSQEREKRHPQLQAHQQENTRHWSEFVLGFFFCLFCFV